MDPALSAPALLAMFFQDRGSSIQDLEHLPLDRYAQMLAGGIGGFSAG
jgi:hypothetical protein